MYIEGPPPLYISCANPEQTKQDWYQQTLEAAGDKGQRIKKVTKVNESKQSMEGGLQSMEFWCLLFRTQSDIELPLSSCALCNHQQIGKQFFVCKCTLANH